MCCVSHSICNERGTYVVTNDRGYLHLSSNIMAICTLYGITNEEISDACSVPMSVVHEWRNGKRIPISAAYSISKLLGINVDEMF